MTARIVCGDFLQLPSVLATASMLAPPGKHSYEHHQGVVRLASVPYVLNFIEMKRFEDDTLQLQCTLQKPGGFSKLVSKVTTSICRFEFQLPSVRVCLLG